MRRHETFSLFGCAVAGLLLQTTTPAQDPPKPITKSELKRVRIALDGISKKERAAALEAAVATLGGRPAESSEIALELARTFFAAGLDEAASPFGIQFLASLKKGGQKPGGVAGRMLGLGLVRAPDMPTFLAFAKEGRRVFPGGGVLRSNYGLLEQLSKAALFEVEPKTLAEMRKSAAHLLIKGDPRKRFLGWTGLLGKPAPELLMPHVLGAKLSAKDLAGKVVLLDFFAFWCGPCKAAFPHLRELHEKHHQNGLRIVSVTWFQGCFYDNKTGVKDDPRRKGKKLSKETELGYLEKFRKAYDIPWAMVVEGEAYYRVRGLTDKDNRKNCASYFMRPIPQIVAIDRAGKVRLIEVSARNRRLIETTVEVLLDEKVPAKK